jgi:hypothetical protein
MEQRRGGGGRTDVVVVVVVVVARLSVEDRLGSCCGAIATRS